jgi:hypothetical protein
MSGGKHARLLSLFNIIKDTITFLSQYFNYVYHKGHVRMSSGWPTFRVCMEETVI